MRPIHLALIAIIFIITGTCLVYFVFFRPLESETVITAETPPPQLSNPKSDITAEVKRPTGSGEDSSREKTREVREITKGKKDKNIVWMAPSNPVEEEIPSHTSQEVKKKIKEATLLWEKEMDQLFTPDIPGAKELRIEYHKMQEEFLRNRFQIPPPSEEDKRKSHFLSSDEMDDDAKYVQDYDDRLRHLLGEELFWKYGKTRRNFKKKALSENRFPIDF